jgi:hypothetical protein
LPDYTNALAENTWVNWRLPKIELFTLKLPAKHNLAFSVLRFSVLLLGLP